MSTQTGKFREDQVLIICPGSKTTMAQLGCGELTPPVHRIPTRMFKDAETDEWRPFHTFKRKKANTNVALAIDGPRTDDDDYEWVEDTDSDEGAVYPMQGAIFRLLLLYFTFGILIDVLFQAVVLLTWRRSWRSLTMFTACSPPPTTIPQSCSWPRRNGAAPIPRRSRATSSKRLVPLPSA